MVELAPRAVVKEEVFVSATRNDVLIDDEPLKIEVLDREEVEEKDHHDAGRYRMSADNWGTPSAITADVCTPTF
jgi:hypothetical protein